MHHKLYLPVFILFFSLLMIHPAKGASGEDPIKFLTIGSKILSEERNFQVYLPKDYSESKQRYNVIYLLDGKWFFPKTIKAADTLIKKGKISEAIIVGIISPNPEARIRDFYQTQDKEFPSSGGADRFLLFLKDELIPYIDKHYRTTTHRVLFGHSSGGYLATYAFLKAPEAFDGFIASSPGLDWDNNVLIKKSSDFLKKASGLKRFLFIGMGSDGISDYIKSAEKFVSQLRKNSPSGLKWTYKIYEGVGHIDTADRCLIEGITHFFEWLKK